jgi:hypothetical protein
MVVCISPSPEHVQEVPDIDSSHLAAWQSRPLRLRRSFKYASTTLRLTLGPLLTYYSLRFPGGCPTLHRPHVGLSPTRDYPPSLQAICIRSCRHENTSLTPSPSSWHTGSVKHSDTCMLTYCRSPPWGPDRPSVKAEQFTEQPGLKKWIDNYLWVGEWTMDQSVAVFSSSSLFERKR